MEGYLDNIFLNVMMPCVASYKVEEEDGARRVTERLWSILWCYATGTTYSEISIIMPENVH